MEIDGGKDNAYSDDDLGSFSDSDFGDSMPEEFDQDVPPFANPPPGHRPLTTKHNTKEALLQI